MIAIPEGCIKSTDNRKRCVVSENGKSYILENVIGINITVVKIDGCVINSGHEKKCDFLMYYDRDNTKTVIFVELKGGALLTAVKQIHSTIFHLKDNFEGYRKYARIIGSRDVPNIKNSPIYLKLIREIHNGQRGIQIRTNKVYVEQI